MLIVPPAAGGEQFFASTFVEQPNGAIAFREPMTGEIMQPTVVPDVLRNWPILKEGFDFLEQEGHRIDFSLLLGPHERGQDLVDARIDIRAEAQRVKERQGLLFLEGIRLADHDAYLTNLFNDVTQGDRHPDEVRALGVHEFLSDVMDLLYGTGVRVESPDVLLGEASLDRGLLGPLHFMIGQWRSIAEELAATTPSPETSKNLLIGKIGYHNFREWLILGVVGASLSRFRDRAGEMPIVGTLFMGTAHAGMVAKTEALLGHKIRVKGERSLPLGRQERYIAIGLGRLALMPEDIRGYQDLRAT